MSAISALKNSNIVVTGANGFIGSHLVDFLVQHSCNVHAVIRKNSNRQWLNKSDRVKLYITDLEEERALSTPLLKQADYLFHCAGLTKAKTREKYFHANAYACESLYSRCETVGVNLKAIVHLSSLAAAGPSDRGVAAQEKFSCKPITYYGESKLAGEEIAMKYISSIPIVIIRPSVVYGPRELNFLTYLRALNKGWKVKVGTVRRELSLVYITDLVRAMVQAALCFPKDEKIYYVTDGYSYTWDKVADSAMQKLDISAKTLIIPEVLLRYASNIVEVLAWFGSEPALIDRQKVIDICQTSWVASPRLFFESHKFQPKYNLDKGLSETINWCKANNWL